MKWLARIELDAETIRRLEILDSYDWHQRLWDCFPEEPDKKRDYLTRLDVLEGGVRTWMLSPHEPTRPQWCPAHAFAVRQVSSVFLSHRRYAFDLRVNPTKALVQRNPDGTAKIKANGKRASGKRVPLVDTQDLRTWLERKASEGGFRISEAKPLEIGPMVEVHFKKQETTGYHGGVQFRGVLEVTDPIKFAESYAKGIGPAKAFGFGLLLLAPLQS